MKLLSFSFSAILIGPVILGSCQEPLVLDLEPIFEEGKEEVEIIVEDEKEKDKEKVISFEEIMTLTESGDAQGGDCWGDYFFQFVQNNSQVRIYDLSLKTLVQTLRIPTTERGFVSNCHCNTVCFGSEYYDAEDLFPLLYVSTGYASDGYTGALVYRLTQHQGSFFITLVQTLKFPVDKSSWTEFVPGDEFAYLCYTSERVIYKFKMPQLKDGDIILSRDSAIKSFQFTPQPDWMATSRNQDRLFYQGKILYISGVPRSGEASVFVELNLETLERERILDFKKIGLTSEPESIFVWQGDLCVAFIDRIVKLIL